MTGPHAARRLVLPLLVALLTALLAAAASSPAAAAEQVFVEEARVVDGSHYLVGRVTPDAAERTVRYQRRTCATCAWRPYGAVTTDARGRFRIRLEFPRTPGPTWRYRGYVAATAQHDRTVGRVWWACARDTCGR